jgi:hypothetical protein
MVYGTLSTLDSLAATQSSVAQYDEDRAWSEIDVALAAHNDDLNEMMGALVEQTTDRQRRYGSAASKTMQELDQFGQPQAQKVTAGVTLGFPLRLYGDALQWTRKFMMSPGSAQQIAAEIRAIMDADRRNVIYQIKRAIFNPLNYTFADVLTDDVDLAVKRLVNADSASIPLGPNGESFDATTHTHYLFTDATTLAAADLTAAINTVVEHHNNGRIVTYINTAEESAVRGLTGFSAYTDARLVLPGGYTTVTAGAQLDQMNPYDRAIGVYGAAEIHVKPWVPSGYLLTVALDSGMSPLALRTRAGMDGLRLIFEDESHPLRARSYEREFGVGVWARTAASILYIDTGNGGAYVAPTLTN